MKLAACLKTLFFDRLRTVQGCTVIWASQGCNAIFDGCKPLKMGAIRKPRCQTGRLNAAKRKDARERRSNCDVENTMDGFFNRLLDKQKRSLFGQSTICPYNRSCIVC